MLHASDLAPLSSVYIRRDDLSRKRDECEAQRYSETMESFSFSKKRIWQIWKTEHYTWGAATSL